MPCPRVVLHERTGQPASCLQGLVQYAQEIAKTPKAAQLSEQQLLAYLWDAPIVWDSGEGPTVAGCRPAQRSRIWPAELNCWEATAHFLGWCIAQHEDIEVHVFDVVVGKQRHVFPAWRSAGSNEAPRALLLQPPVIAGSNLQGVASYGLGRSMAQAWYNDLLGAVHVVGDTVLRAYGLGGAADKLAETEGDALPDWARTTAQKAQRTAKKAEETKDKAAELVGKAAKSSESQPPPPANRLELVPDGRGGVRNYGPPIC